MQANEYELMKEVQGKHWWWLGREKILRDLMDKYLLQKGKDCLIADVGSGFGANIRMLSEYGNVCALETDDHCVEYIRSVEPGIQAIKWKSPDPVDLKFDAVLLADVLEHIEEDHAAMDWIANHLKPGGLAFITVPAHMHLWSEMDDVVHHYRRYSKERLLDVVGTKFKIEKVSFYNATLYPVKILFVGLTKLFRLLKPSKPKQSYNDLPPNIINNVFKYIMYLESIFLKWLDFPMGVSLVMVLRKIE